MLYAKILSGYRIEGQDKPLYLEYPSKYAKKMLLGSLRNYIIKKVKKPLMEKIISLVSKYPEPTRENCLHPNTHILLDIKEKFFEHDTNKGRRAFFEATWKLFIAEYEHDAYYRFRIDWMLEQIAESDWQPRSMFLLECWKEFEDAEKVD